MSTTADVRYLTWESAIIVESRNDRHTIESASLWYITPSSVHYGSSAL
jgi:hypothetical protein